MPSHAKRAHLDPTPDILKQTKSLSENDFGSEDESNDMEREIQVEARTLQERGLPGVISRLKQCFRRSEDVKLGALAQYVLKQKSVGSVVTQCLSDCADDEDVDESGKNFL